VDIDNKQQTEVRLRPWSEGDLWLGARLLGDPEMTKYLGGPETPEQIRARHERWGKMGETGKGRMFVILVGPEGSEAGSIGYWEREEAGETVWETGWSVLPEFQGRGIATRAIAEAVKSAREEGKHRFVHAYPSVDNAPSNAICRKAGFTNAGEFEFEYPPGNPIRCNDWYLELA
jgi:RimJ/RimL family protein N-acetyltransferase